MKALIHEKYGTADVLQLKELEKPAPKENEILVKVLAASLNAYDWHFLSADIFLIRVSGGGFFKPKNTRLGADISGRVEAVGANVRQYKPGDEVLGDLAGYGNGGFSEYVCVPEKAVILKPAGLSFEQAAALPMAGITALQALRDTGRVREGQKVLINGATGGVGTFAMQIAKAFGAQITAVCSTGKMDLVRSLGADIVIDYTKEDFTKNGQRYDIILAVNGYHPIQAYKRCLTPKGIYVMAGGSPTQIFQALLLGTGMSEKGGRKLGSMVAHVDQKELGDLLGLVEAGKVAPVIDRSYPLIEAIEAFRYLGTGHARGKIVITME
jgi:NADPH:quinone reductase-like Zn-dependent oxidoreductase